MPHDQHDFANHTETIFAEDTFLFRRENAHFEGECPMCDYSLHMVRSRDAKVGDRLISTRFAGSETRGFAAIGEPGVAVCLLPGTELVFDGEIETAHAFARLLPSLRFGMQGTKLARFRRVNPHQPHVHHDALELANGGVVLVTKLREGQRATILQLPTNSRLGETSPESAAELLTNPGRADRSAVM